VPRPNWFIAFVVPPEAGWHHAGDAMPPGLRRFDPADLHLTLAFLGACPKSLAWCAWEACAPLHQAPITVTAGSWRAMGPAARPTAYALTLQQGREPIARLIEVFGIRLREMDAGPAAAAGSRAGPPLPHITMARPRRREAAQARVAMEAWMGGAPIPRDPLSLHTLALYTWTHDRSLRLFRLVAQRDLGPGPSHRPSHDRPV
jgi:2'-5' RNA ligase